MFWHLLRRFAEPNGVPPRRPAAVDFSPTRDNVSPLSKKATSPRYRKQLLHRLSTDSMSSDYSDDDFGENVALPSVGSLLVSNVEEPWMRIRRGWVKSSRRKAFRSMVTVQLLTLVLHPKHVHFCRALKLPLEKRDHQSLVCIALIPSATFSPIPLPNNLRTKTKTNTFYAFINVR